MVLKIYYKVIIKEFNHNLRFIVDHFKHYFNNIIKVSGIQRYYKTHRVLAPRTSNSNEGLAVLPATPRCSFRQGLIALSALGSVSLALQDPMMVSPGLLLKVGITECRPALYREVLLTVFMQNHSTSGTLHLVTSVPNTSLE